MTAPKQSSSGSDELIDWLNDQIRFHGTSAAANDPAIQGHIAFLQRAIARLNGVAQGAVDSGERCPTCGMTDAGYSVYIKGYCRDPWHGDDHLRAKASSPPAPLQAGEISPEMLDAGAQALVNDVWHPPQPLSSISQTDASRYRRQALLVLKAALAMPSTQRCTWPNCDQPSGHDYCYSHCLADRGAAVASTPRATGEG